MQNHMKYISIKKKLIFDSQTHPPIPPLLKEERGRPDLKIKRSWFKRKKERV